LKIAIAQIGIFQKRKNGGGTREEGRGKLKICGMAQMYKKKKAMV
jgi:hypothetical protein